MKKWIIVVFMFCTSIEQAFGNDFLEQMHGILNKKDDAAAKADQETSNGAASKHKSIIQEKNMQTVNLPPPSPSPDSGQLGDPKNCTHKEAGECK